MIEEYTKEYFEDLLKVSQNIHDLANFKDKKFLITGANGLIGAAFVDFLLFLNDYYQYNINIILGIRNYEKARIRFGEQLNRKDVQVFEYDALSTTVSISNIDYILHAASPANPTQYNQSPVETMHANYFGMKNILDYGVKHDCRILFISSSEVYGIKQDIQSFSEEDYGYVDILNSRACYPSIKRAAETLCVSYHAEYGVDVIIARPGHVYGPTSNLEDNRAASDFMFQAVLGKDIILKSQGLQERSYCYVLDCISALLYLFIKGQAGTAYNVASNSMTTSIKRLAQTVCTVANCQLVFDVAENNNKQNPMNHSVLDGKRLQHLGWNSCFSLYDGVLHTYQVMKKMQNRWINYE